MKSPEVWSLMSASLTYESGTLNPSVGYKKKKGGVGLTSNRVLIPQSSYYVIAIIITAILTFSEE